MPLNPFIRNVSSQTIQLLLNQCFGLLIFYALSGGLDKNLFGQLNWALAILLTVFGVLTFGIDQLMVKKIAAGFEPQTIFSAYLLHVLVTGSIFYLLLMICHFVFAAHFPLQNLVLYVAIGKFFIFLSTPFKQVATGLEKFNLLLYMSVVSNIVRGIGLLLLLVFETMTITNVLLLFIAGDLAELITCVLLRRLLLNTKLTLNRDKKFQFSLVKEALPQAGSFLFSAISARFDWILIGILVSAVELAEYSFAWKVFEMSTLPLLIVAPVIIPLFTRIITKAGNIQTLSFLLEWQVIAACFVGLLLNICYSPVADFISNEKYGGINNQTIFILSLSMPVLYMNNYFWTINFAKGRLKMIFGLMAVAFTVNIIACSLLIPLHGKLGAAIAHLCSSIILLRLYLVETQDVISRNVLIRLCCWPLFSMAIGLLLYSTIKNTMLAFVLGMIVFIAALLIGKTFSLKNWQTLLGYYK